jgi:hypothetical protein
MWTMRQAMDLHFTGQWELAAEGFREMAERFPERSAFRQGLGEMLLGMGDYQAGWDAYEARLETPANCATERLPFPTWQGEPLAGKTLLVWREQGFGDKLMCARFLPILRAMGAKLIVCTAKKLWPLHLGMGLDAFPFIPGEPLKFAKPDYVTYPFSIPRWLGITPDTIPAAPYVTGKRIPGPKASIGVVTRGRAEHPRDAQRSLPDHLAAELLALPGAIDLDPAKTGARHFQDTANIIAGLDLVISVDTAIAHLAGAMGKPLYLMLPQHGLDWRWMREREDSPWYPSAQLFRQREPGDWAPVVERVKAAA